MLFTQYQIRRAANSGSYIIILFKVIVTPFAFKQIKKNSVSPNISHIYYLERMVKDLICNLMNSTKVQNEKDQMVQLIGNCSAVEDRTFHQKYKSKEPRQFFGSVTGHLGL